VNLWVSSADRSVAGSSQGSWTAGHPPLHTCHIRADAVNPVVPQTADKAAEVLATAAAAVGPGHGGLSSPGPAEDYVIEVMDPGGTSKGQPANGSGGGGWAWDGPTLMQVGAALRCTYCVLVAGGF
jgi:hypothetical protein